MTPWDDDKSTASDPDNPSANEQLTADEWDDMVADQKGHAARHESGGSDALSLLASQISDFASSVISSIQGAAIAPDSVDTTTLEAAKADTRGGYSELSLSRALDTTETNNSGSDMNVSINLVPTSDGSFIRARLKVEGENVSRYKKICNLNEGGNVSAVVPDGSRYQLEALGDTANYELQTWYEQT